MDQKWVKFGKKAFNLLRYDPSAFLRRAKANVLLPILPQKDCTIVVNGISFYIESSLGKMTKEMCYEFYETELTALVKKYIRKGDICIDVGANIGYITAFMMGLVGKKGEVHSFEPVPEYFDRLKRVKTDNPNYRLSINAAAVGDFEGTATINVTGNGNIGWNTMVPNFMNVNNRKAEIEVPVIRLDDYLATKNIKNVRLIKIDTEGYEFPVLKGLKKYLDEAEQLPVLIVEVAPNAYPKLDTSLDAFTDYIQSYGYIGHDVLTGQKVNLASIKQTSNILFTHPDFH
jgi:FkbM family methyltransferase